MKLTRGSLRPLKILKFVFLLVGLWGCLQSNSNKDRPKARNTFKTTTTPSPEVSPTITDDEDKIYWYLRSKIIGAITINRNDQSVVYIKGNLVNSFLNTDSNFSKNYCLVVELNLGSSSSIRQVRLRAVPIMLTNFTTSSKDRIFRIDLSTPVESSAQCQGTVNGFSSASQLSFQIADACPSCSSIFSASSVKLYFATSTTIADANLIPTTQLETSPLILKINPSDDTSDPTSNCSNSNCRAKGYDCCLNGQCIKDGAEKPGASSLSNYAQAMADVAVSPANFIYWQEIFYTCPNRPLPTPTATATPNAIPTATAELEAMKALYFCINSAELTVPDYSNCKPNEDLASYLAIKDIVWQMCECATVGTPAPDDPTITCPNYGLKAYDLQGILLENLTIDKASSIFSVSCSVPPVLVPTPFQLLNLKLSTRTVPHRFFKQSDGSEVTDITKIFGTPEPMINLAGTPINAQGTPFLVGTPATPAYVSEGDGFFYLDEVTKSEPNPDEKFNMNSILGQMKVNLTAAIPAKALQVELDQTYIIRTIEGNYTPCPTCPRDNWFTAFTAHPPSQFGTGLQAVGHTTTRDTWSTNLTTGNYEDTIFGRACWLPPTMIPFSHKARPNTDSSLTVAKDQRKYRLQTQAAFYMNGYQKDWFGFNKGALIGSFDGVRWFAIGKNRRVRATSNQLFLAINAPFGDLAENSELTIQVVQDDLVSTVPDLDYNPEISRSHPLQNEAGNCQFYHMCTTDSECITKLGWEYVCANVSSYRTLMPKFDIDAQEIVNQSVSGSYSKVIHGDLIPGNSFRCVYRGAGAPCQVDYFQISDPKLRKAMACAPNFYCASISTTTNAFNDRLSREPNPSNPILFGKGSNVLGRPLKYINAGFPLSTEIGENIEANAALKGITNVGLCRPGKSIAFSGINIDPTTQHANSDIAKRTDYISQISSCNSDAKGLERVHSCPFLNSDGNYYYTAPGINSLTPTLSLSLGPKIMAQNECGSASLSSDLISPFKDVETEPLESINGLLFPTLVRDACLRRAGSICHTEYDCTPNKFHAEQTRLFGTNYFGNTEAERRYWEESLVCAQGPELPNINSVDAADIAAAASYNISDNRCCRSIGLPFSMYTEGDPLTNIAGDSLGLRTSSAFYSVRNPLLEGRYSRYTVLDALSSNEADFVSTSTTAITMWPLVEARKRPKKYQWKTFNETGRLTCCGGTWIRKFADGTNNWIISNRLHFNVKDFECINFRTPVYRERPPLLHAEDPSWEQDLDFLCRDPARKGCLHYNIKDTNSSFIPIAPITVDATTDTTILKTDANCTGFPNSPTCTFASIHTEMRTGFLSDLVPFRPRKSDFDVSNIDIAPISFYLNGPDEKRMVVQLPSYINGAENIKAVYFTQRLKDPDPDSGEPLHDLTTKAEIPPFNGGAQPYTTDQKLCPWAHCTDDCTDATDYAEFRDTDLVSSAAEKRGWCFERQTGRLYLLRKFCDVISDAACIDNDKLFPLPDANSKYHATRWGALIEFFPMGTAQHLYSTASTPALELSQRGTEIRSMTPGNDQYYLKKLERYELLGIPQIYYEPIYCNDKKDELVPGIFNVIHPTSSTRFGFESSGYSFTMSDESSDALINLDLLANPSKKAVLQREGTTEKLELDDIFSNNEFLCCQKLGAVTSNPLHCCTSFGILNNGGTKYTCTLPLKTDLHVYFNRYVSSEGIEASLGDIRLLDTDFDPQTGYPKPSVEVFNKITKLGQKFCDGGNVFTGAAFGRFDNPLKPESGRGSLPHAATDVSKGIVSFEKDLDSTNNSTIEGSKGFLRFNEGRRWNHHLYCGNNR